MDETGKFWFGIVGLVAFVIVSLIGAITYDSIKSTNALEKMVKSGADPVAAHCAVHNAYQTNVCVSYVAKKNFNAYKGKGFTFIPGDDQ